MTDLIERWTGVKHEIVDNILKQTEDEEDEIDL